jgi:hypothetical protein
MTREYLEDGTVRTSYFDTEGQPVVIQQGYAVLEQYYDEEKQQTGEAYFGADGNPILLAGGYASYEIESAGDGTQRKVYYDLSGTIVKTEDK